MKTITKKILIDRIAESTDLKRVAVKQVVQEFLDQVIVELGEGNRLEFRDFGVFEVKQRAPRIAQNPKTLERVPVPAKRTVKFKVGRRMREAMETSDGKSDQLTHSEQAMPPRVTSIASQAESKIRVELGADVVGSIRSENSPAHSEHEAAGAH